jgi:hypothetical protein
LKTGTTSKAGSQKGRVKSKSGVTPAATAQEDVPARSNKHSQTKSTTETAKKARHDDDPQSQPDHDEVNQSHSENRSSKSQFLTAGRISGSELGFQHLLLKRNHGGKEFDELLMNTSIVDFMDSKESIAAFATFTAKVSTGCQCKDSNRSFRLTSLTHTLRYDCAGDC